MFRFISFLFLIGTTTQIYANSSNGNINSDLIPNPYTLPTPQNLSSNTFGQWIIGWGTGAEGARQRLDHIQREDIVVIKQKGTTLEMIQAWQQYYENEAQNNSSNPTARYRARLMKRIAELW